jgi:hypothetical protein
MEAQPHRIACRDQDGRRRYLQVWSLGDRRVGIGDPAGGYYVLEPLSGVGGMRHALRSALIESALAAGTGRAEA